jgi:hypothetical protein
MEEELTDAEVNVLRNIIRDSMDKVGYAVVRTAAVQSLHKSLSVQREAIRTRGTALFSARRALQHAVPGDCWSTGPLTGTIADDECVGCTAIRAIDRALGERIE